MKFYLASKYSDRLNICTVAFLLRQNGHDIIAEWLRGENNGTDQPDFIRKGCAEVDLRDIDSCEALVIFNDVPESPGRNIEYGYALAKGKRLIVVGGGTSIFFQLAHERYKTREEFVRHYSGGGSIL